MAEYLIQDTTLIEIADAVRAKTNKTDEILVSDLAEEINGISGGADLNFEVVAYATEEELLAATPEENTIGIITENEITGYHFSAEQPNPISAEIYTEDGATIGKYLNSSGAETTGSNSNWIATSKIALPNGTISVQLTASETGGSNPYHWFYDEAGNPISGVVRQSGTVTYDVPDGAKSIRVSLLSNEDDKSIIANYYEPTEGMVWISTGAFSSVEFNTLKKNGIQVYPLSAKQYIDGTWVDKTAKSYLGGEWQAWIYDLYTDGSEWETASIAYGSEYTAILKPSVSKNSDGSTKLTYTHNSGEWRSGAWRLKTTQSLTGRNVLKIQCSASIPSKGISENIVPELYVIQVSATYWRTQAVALLKLNKSDVSTLTLDISELEGNYNIGIGFRWNKAWLGAGTTTVTVHDVWLE